MSKTPILVQELFKNHFIEARLGVDRKNSNNIVRLQRLAVYINSLKEQERTNFRNDFNKFMCDNEFELTDSQYLLYVACGDDNLKDCIYVLVEYLGCDVNTKYLMFEQTVLHLVAQYGSREVVAFLLSKGADINAKNRFDKTPLHLAIENGRTDIVECLLSKEADINIKDNLSNTALDTAIFYDKNDIFNLLLSKEENINATDTQRTAQLYLYCAVFNERWEMVETLLKRGAKIGERELLAIERMHTVPDKIKKQLPKRVNKEAKHVSSVPVEYSNHMHTGTGFVVGSLIGVVLAGSFVVGKMIATGIALLAAFSAFSIILPALGILFLGGIIGGFIGYMSSVSHKQTVAKLSLEKKSLLDSIIMLQDDSLQTLTKKPTEDKCGKKTCDLDAESEQTQRSLLKQTCNTEFLIKAERTGADMSM